MAYAFISVPINQTCSLKGETAAEYKLRVNYFATNYSTGLARTDIEFATAVLDSFGNYKLFNKLRLTSISRILLRREHYLPWVFSSVILE